MKISSTSLIIGIACLLGAAAVLASAFEGSWQPYDSEASSLLQVSAQSMAQMSAPRTQPSLVSHIKKMTRRLRNLAPKLVAVTKKGAPSCGCKKKKKLHFIGCIPCDVRKQLKKQAKKTKTLADFIKERQSAAIGTYELEQKRYWTLRIRRLVASYKKQYKFCIQRSRAIAAMRSKGQISEQDYQVHSARWRDRSLSTLTRLRHAETARIAREQDFWHSRLKLERSSFQQRVTRHLSGLSSHSRARIGGLLNAWNFKMNRVQNSLSNLLTNENAETRRLESLLRGQDTNADGINLRVATRINRFRLRNRRRLSSALRLATRRVRSRGARGANLWRRRSARLRRRAFRRQRKIVRLLKSHPYKGVKNVCRHCKKQCQVAHRKRLARVTRRQQRRKLRSLRRRANRRANRRAGRLLRRGRAFPFLKKRRRALNKNRNSIAKFTARSKAKRAACLSHCRSVLCGDGLAAFRSRLAKLHGQYVRMRRIHAHMLRSIRQSGIQSLRMLRQRFESQKAQLLGLQRSEVSHLMQRARLALGQNQKEHQSTKNALDQLKTRCKKQHAEIRQRYLSEKKKLQQQYANFLNRARGESRAHIAGLRHRQSQQSNHLNRKQHEEKARLRNIQDAEVGKMVSRHQQTLKEAQAARARALEALVKRQQALIKAASRQSCANFWKQDGGCPAHMRANEGNHAWACGDRKHCIQQCCMPKQWNCEVFDEYFGCPHEYRPIAKRFRSRTCTDRDHCQRSCCEGVPAGNGRCIWSGDPHWITFDGVRFDCQHQAEYIQYKNDVLDEEIHHAQVRHGHVAFSYAVGFRAGPSVFEFGFNNYGPSFRRRLDGKEVQVPFDNTWVTLENAFRVKVEPRHMWGQWAYYASIVNVQTKTAVNIYFPRHCGYPWCIFWHVEIVLGFRPNRYKSEGLCGTFNLNPHDDLTHRDGRSHCRDTYQSTGGPFPYKCCESWISRPGESLFNVPVKKDKSPAQSISLKDICHTKSRLKQARQACAKVPSKDRHTCITDACNAFNAHSKQLKNMVKAEMHTINKAEHPNHHPKVGHHAQRAQQRGMSRYAFVVSCPMAHQHRQNCQNSYTVRTTFQGTVQARYVVPASHCSSIRVKFSVDGRVVYTSPPLGFQNRGGPMQTRLVDLRTAYKARVGADLPDGVHVVGVGAIGVPGGCNSGVLSSWGGALEVHRS